MPRVIEKTVYKFNELSQTAKENAVENYNYTTDYTPQADEINQSFDKADVLYSELEELSDYIHNQVYSWEGEYLVGFRLFKWLNNNMSTWWEQRVSYKKTSNGNAKSTSTYTDYAKDTYRLSNVQLTQNSLENCPLTGCTWDFEAMNSIIDFMKKPNNTTTIQDLIDDRNTRSSVLDKNHEETTTFEYVSEEIKVHDYEFYEDGESYND